MDNTVMTITDSANQDVDPESFDKALAELASRSGRFSGERYVPGAGVRICYEHLHRYLFVLQMIQSEHTVLDLGCGIGYGSLLLATKAKQVIALDRDSKSIALLKSVAQNNNITNLSTVEVDLNDLETFLNNLTERIDVVTCFEVIEHIPEQLQSVVISILARTSKGISKSSIICMSTPDREVYAQSSETENPFHEHELSKKEFEDMLKRHFSHVQSYEQHTGTMNLLHRSDAFRGLHEGTIQHIGWQDEFNMVPALSKVQPTEAEYIVALSSQSPLPARQPISVLADTSNQYVRERLSESAAELRRMNEKVRLADRSRDEIAKDIKKDYEGKIEELNVEIRNLNSVIERQAHHIRHTEQEAERIGSEFSNLYVRIRDMDTQIIRLKPWHEVAGSLLGDTPEAVAKRVYYLKSCEQALQSPGHRLISLIGRILKLPLRLWRA